MAASQKMPHSVQSATLADVLERILDKGLVIAGDIKIKLVDIELLTIQIRLLIASVDKAKELGLDWWSNNSFLNPIKAAAPPTPDATTEQELRALRERVRELEAAAKTPAAVRSGCSGDTPVPTHLIGSESL